MIIPSIDIMDGKAVQLIQGKEKAIERDDVMSLAKEFGRYGEIAVIDLDSALSKGDNMKLIKEICKVADCRVGGGIRSIEKANELLSAGARKIIIGTNATPEFLSKLPKSRVIAAIDTKGGHVVDKGWTESTGRDTIEVARELEDYCSEFLFTNVDKEGLMKGCDLDMIKAVKKAVKNKLTVAGGITTIEEVKSIEDMGANSQIGMSVYTGKMKLPETFASLLEFGKCGGMIPTIVQDDRGQVLMLAYSTRESVIRSMETGEATYYSRSRKSLWRKGEVSGNFQDLIRADYDCDRDALLFTVKQKNVACHKGDYSCFSDPRFNLEQLYDVIRERVKNPSEKSYTSKISRDEKKIMEKIREECDEVIGYKDRDNLIWEISDIIYFLLVLMAKKGISAEEVRNELWRRRK